MGVDNARDASEKYLVFKTLHQHCSYTQQNIACKLPPIPKRTYQLGIFSSPPVNFKQKSVLFLRYPLASNTPQASMQNTHMLASAEYDDNKWLLTTRRIKTDTRKNL